MSGGQDTITQFGRSAPLAQPRVVPSRPHSAPASTARDSAGLRQVEMALETTALVVRDQPVISNRELVRPHRRLRQRDNLVQGRRQCQRAY